MKMRAVFSLIAVFLVAVFVYVLPGLTATALIRQNLNPWLTCVVAGDLAGCAVLFLLGRRAMSIGLYALLGMAESVILTFHALTPLQLVWFAGAIPALFVCVVLVKTGLRNMAMETEY